MRTGLLNSINTPRRVSVSQQCKAQVYEKLRKLQHHIFPTEMPVAPDPKRPERLRAERRASRREETLRTVRVAPHSFEHVERERVRRSRRSAARAACSGSRCVCYVIYVYGLVERGADSTNKCVARKNRRRSDCSGRALANYEVRRDVLCL